jgi:chromate reductase
MITIISGTDRKDSKTLRVAAYYTRLLREKTDEEVHLLSLEGLNVWEKGGKLKETEQRLLIPSEKFVFIMPEYNGSLPGILKLMFDNSDIKRCWWLKKAMLTGVADGRAGNLRGMDHLTNILNYLKINVFYNKVPLSRINDEIDKDGNLLKQETVKLINNQVEEFLKF